MKELFIIGCLAGLTFSILKWGLYAIFYILFITIPNLIFRHFDLGHWNIIRINDKKYLLTTKELIKLEKDNPGTYFFHHALHVSKLYAKHHHKDAERYKSGD